MPRRMHIAPVGLIFVSILLSVLTVPPVFAFMPAASDRAPLVASDALLKQRLFEITQSHHVRAGCEAWKHDPRLDAAAQLHAEDIARHQYVSHVGTDGATVAQRLRRQGYPANRATEGIALYRTPEKVVAFWMGEPPSGPHRRNITWCQYTDAGIGLAYDRNGQRWWVMDYANRSGRK